MYTYIYDSFLGDKKYQGQLFHIEARLFELGIQGRIEKVSMLKSVSEMVRDAASRKSETVVAVGNDDTISKIIGSLPTQELTLGIIPIGPNNAIAEMLGIAPGVEACDILSRRIVERIDLGRANGQFFLSKLEVTDATNITLECNGYRVIPTDTQTILKICNIATLADHRISSPRDGVLEAVFGPVERKNVWGIFKKEYSSSSVFPITKAHLRSTGENVAVVADGSTTLKTPVSIDIARKELRVIVGKTRLF